MSYQLDYSGQEVNERLQLTDLIYPVAQLIDLIYPIGSIYMSVSSTSPATLFGGTWEQIEDTFLLAAGSSYEAGAVGGEVTHTLTTEEMPEHRHKGRIGLNQSGYGINIESWELYVTSSSTSPADGFKVTTSDTSTHLTNVNTRTLQTTTIAGESAAHNNMPPYLAVYMWKRIA